MQRFQCFIDLGGLLVVQLPNHQIDRKINNKNRKGKVGSIVNATENPHPMSEHDQHRFQQCEVNEFANQRLTEGQFLWQVGDGYRSIQTQQRVWEDTYQKYRTVNGLSKETAEEATRRRVATPGASEHHTGLAVDLTVPGESFLKTPQSAWFRENCWDYGFIIRYTEEKERLTGTSAKPWRIRYVGLPYSLLMKEKGLCLEEYMAILLAS